METTIKIEDKIIDPIKNRWSPVIFSDKNIDNETMRVLFEAARWAPSSYNDQPWRYVYAHRGSSEFNKIVDGLMEANAVWAKHASVLIITMSEKNYSIFPDKENYHSLYDLGAANAFLMNQATAMGLFTHSMGGIFRDVLQRNFNLSDSLHISSVIALGYHGSIEGKPIDWVQREKSPRSRREVGEFVLNMKTD